jgi:hypothetical protein
MTEGNEALTSYVLAIAGEAGSSIPDGPRGRMEQGLRKVDDRRGRLGWVTLAEISPALEAAVLASEDRRFHAHGGVDARAVAAATLARLSGRGPRGASTITMQLASALDPALRGRGAPRSMPQKVRQMRVAWAIEARWSKREILEADLNLVNLLGRAPGHRRRGARPLRQGAARADRPGGARPGGAPPRSQCRASAGGQAIRAAGSG